MNGFALGGGGGKIGFSGAVVYTLNKLGIVPEIISAISSGGLVGIMAATGQLEILKKILLFEITNDLVYKKRGYLRYGWRFLVHKLGLRSPLMGIHNNEPLKDLIHSHIYGKVMQCEYYAGIININNGQFKNVKIPKGVILKGANYDYWLNTILATTAIPIMFKPVKFDNGLWVDGGLHTHTPFTPLRKAIINSDVNRVYAVSMLDPAQKKEKPPKDDFEKLAKIVQELVTKLAKTEIDNYEIANLAAKLSGGSFEKEGKVYKYYPGEVFRPTQQLNDSLDFNYKNMRRD